MSRCETLCFGWSKMDCDRILNPIAPHLINTITVESSLPEKAVNVCCHDEVSGKGTRELRCLWLKSIKIHQMSQRKKLTQAANVRPWPAIFDEDCGSRRAARPDHIQYIEFLSKQYGEFRAKKNENRGIRISFNRKSPRQHSDFVQTVLDVSSL